MNHVLVTGGAGFLGSHLCNALLERGDRVTAVDNFGTGHRASMAPITGHPRFALRTVDTTALGCFADLDRITHIAHLARAGSPLATVRHPVATMRAASSGTLAVLDLAAAHKARLVVASGTDAHAGSARPGLWTAPSSVHAAGNQLIESAVRHYPDVYAGILRPFEVYGPHLWPGDGRITATICGAALRDQSLCLPYPGTAHFVYVADAIEAVIRMLDVEHPGPVDIGGPAVTLTEFGRTAFGLTGMGWLDTPASASALATGPPDLDTTYTALGWQPTTGLGAGLAQTLDWMRATLSRRVALEH